MNINSKTAIGDIVAENYKAAFSPLKEFEEDLHKHIHLENNFLLKKRIVLEKIVCNN